MARVRKHRNKWQVLFRDPDTGRERSAGVFVRKSDASAAKRQVEHQIETEQWIDPRRGDTSFTEFASTWLVTRSDLKPKTIEGYESLLNSRILPAFGHRRLRSIRPIDIDLWVSEQSKQGISASRVRQATSVMSLVFESAVLNMAVQSNPVTGLRLPRKQHREMLFLTAQDVIRLRSAVPDRYDALVGLLAACGLRAGEAIALRRSRVNLLRQEIVVAESATEVHGALVFGETKNRKHRTVAIPKFLTIDLESHLAQFVGPSPDSLVFTTDEGSALRLSNFRNRVWKPALLASGLPAELRIHDLRHTAASLLIAQGIHPKSIQEHLGHSSIAVTMDRYGHLYPEERIRVADALDKAFDRSAM